MEIEGNKTEIILLAIVIVIIIALTIGAIYCGGASCLYR